MKKTNNVGIKEILTKAIKPSIAKVLFPIGFLLLILTIGSIFDSCWYRGDVVRNHCGQAGEVISRVNTASYFFTYPSDIIAGNVGLKIFGTWNSNTAVATARIVFVLFYYFIGIAAHLILLIGKGYFVNCRKSMAAIS